MAKRKTLYEAPELRLRDAELVPGPNAYGYQIRSRSLEFAEDVLRIKLRYADNEKHDARQVDFSKCYLPPNRLHPHVTLLKDRPDFARIVVAVVDGYVIRQQNTKSTALTSRSLASTVVRFLEYCWINDIYHLKSVTPARWDVFLRDFAAGGWLEVLRLQERAWKLDLRTLPLSRKKHKKGVVEYSCSALLEAIGTNVTVNQVQLQYARGDARGELKRAKGGEALISESLITQVVSQLNNLVDLPKEMRAASVAHVNPYLLAKSLETRPQGRTQNFNPRALGALMAEAYRWVSQYGSLIVGLARKVYAEQTPSNGEDLNEARLFVLLEAKERLELERLLGARITSVRRVGGWREGIGLLGLIRTLLSACFVLLGVFNARRKDEIQSKSIGLYAEAFRSVDDELRLYESYFYCEKTSHDYLPFYVNEISFDALNVCRQIADLAWNLAVQNGGALPKGRARKIFCIPPRSNEVVPTWYLYENDPGIELLCERATGERLLIIPNAHMFRRAYAVVFHYRYENADLYALSQQLDHRDLAMTLHYVLDGASRVLAHHAATLWGDGGQTKKERALRAAELATEVIEYGKVKLHDDILEILTGTAPVGGGFAKLIQRFTRKMYGRIRYDDASLKAAAAQTTELLVARGHNVIPLRHGNCNAGPAKPSAGCFQGGSLRRENASPVLCGNCPYHTMKAVHLQAVQDDLAWQRDELSKWPGTSIQSAHARQALEATEKLVDFYVQQRQQPRSTSV
jgi:hypothetical protein